MTEQQALLTAILNGPNRFEQAGSQFESRGLAIYQRNLLANANRALQITFPTVLQLIGEELFEYATGQLLKNTPPCEGDWGLWGQDFAKVLQGIEALQNYSYVADSARLDFAHHMLERQPDYSPDITSMNLLAQHSLDDIQLVLNPNLVQISSSFPVVDIFFNHMQLAQENLKNGIGQNALLFRPQYKAQVRALSEAEHYWITLIKLGVKLGTALDAMESKKFNDFAFEKWLPMAIKQNLIHCLKRA